MQRPDWSESFLGLDGWQVAETTIPTLTAAADGSDQLVRVGLRPASTSRAAGTSWAFPELGIEEPVYWPEIVPPHGGGTGYFSSQDRVKIKPSPTPPTLLLHHYLG